MACPGKSRCNDPLVYRPAYFVQDEPSKVNCRQQWKARQAEIEVLAKRAEKKCNAAKRIPVIGDTMLLRAYNSGTKKAPSIGTLCCLTQWWIHKYGRALPCFGHRILAFLDINVFHDDQLTVAEFSAYHLRSVITHLDGLTIARTTKPTNSSKDNVQDENPGEELKEARNELLAIP